MNNYDLIVDSREKINTFEALKAYNIQYTIEALPVGDLKVTTPDGSVVIERKQMTDFIGSLLSGRLEEQARKLANEKCPGLILTGSFQEYRQHAKTTKLTTDHVIGAIASLVVKYGLRFVIWIQSAENKPHATGIAVAAKIAKKIAEGKLDQIPDRRLKKKTDNPQREIVSLICGVPCVVAENLLKKFGCIRAIMDAKDEELLEVDGMGKIRIAKMRRLLGDDKNDKNIE